MTKLIIEAIESSGCLKKVELQYATAKPTGFGTSKGWTIATVQSEPPNPKPLTPERIPNRQVDANPSFRVDKDKRRPQPFQVQAPAARYWKLRFVTNHWEDDDWAGVGRVLFHGQAVSSGGSGAPLCEELESSTFEEKLRLVEYFEAQGPSELDGLTTSVSLLASQAEVNNPNLNWKHSTWYKNLTSFKT